MAAETDTQSYGYNWSHPHLPSDHQVQETQAKSISQILDHGSVSFGRFATESLAWEKWSVFSHNRHQEELEKFKAPGLVAQKKAYFEEYFKKIRAIKALQTEQQETTQSTHLQDEQSSTTDVENCVDFTMLKEERKKPNSVVDQFQAQDTDQATTYQDSYGVGSGGNSVRDSDEQRGYCCGNYNDDSVSNSMNNGIEISISITELDDDSTVEADPKPSLSVSTCLGANNIIVSDAVKNNVNKPGNNVPLVKKVKGAVASSESKIKLDSRVKGQAVKRSEKIKPSFRMEGTGKVDGSFFSSRRTTTRAANNIKSSLVSSHRPLPEIASRATAVHTSFVKDKSASPTCSIKGNQPKTTVNSRGLTTKLPETSPVHAQGHSSLQIPVAGSARNTALGNRRTSGGDCNKSSEFNGRHHFILKGGQLENQRLKETTVNVPAQRKSTQNRGTTFGHTSFVRGENQSETAPLRSADRKHDQRELRQQMPNWR